MRILFTHNGRNGDLLWQLPLIRWVSERIGRPVDLITPAEFQAIHDLLAWQPYLGRVTAIVGWAQQDRVPPLDDSKGYWSSTYDHIIHCGYRGWPEPDLVRHTLETFYLHGQQQRDVWRDVGAPQFADLQLDRPWITLDGPGPPVELAVGFTEAWFELKFGLLASIGDSLPPYVQLTPPGTRWRTEGVGKIAVQEGDWGLHARTIRNADRFFGDCSALHVLAVAMGKPVILMEPMEARWNPIFYPLGMDGPPVRVIRGIDGKPTFDARAVREALTGVRKW